MRRMRLLVALLTLLAILAACGAGGSSRKKCTKGKPCGNTCIAMDKTCHK